LFDLPKLGSVLPSGLGSATAWVMACGRVLSWAWADAVFADCVVRVSPSVVSVFTPQYAPAGMTDGPQFGFPEGSPFEEFFRRFGMPNGMPAPQDRAPKHGLGSGFLLDSDGYIITTNHVVEEASEVKVKLDDASVLTAKVISTEGNEKDLTQLYEATGCETLPFEPAITQFETSTTAAADLVTDIDVGVAFPSGSATTKGAVVDMPRGFVANAPAVDACLDLAVADPQASCQDTANLGTATATSPLLPYRASRFHAARQKQTYPRSTCAGRGG